MINKKGKINLNGARILLFCPGQLIGTKERKLIEDCELLLKLKMRIFLVCSRDSFIDNRTDSKDIKKIYINSSKSGEVSWRLYPLLSGIFVENRIDYVHCYGQQTVWVVGAVLRKWPLIPLFLSVHHELRKTHFNSLARWVLKRVDRVFVPTSELGDAIVDYIPVGKNKLTVTGMGVTDDSQYDKQSAQVLFKKTDDIAVVATLIKGHVSKIDNIEPFIAMAKSLNSQSMNSESGKKIRFFLLSDRNWESFIIYGDLLKKVRDYDAEDLFEFISIENPRKVQKSVDVWVELFYQDSINYHVISALFEGVPVVLPRTPASAELIRKNTFFGETYRFKDTRELKDDCYRILSEVERYQKEIKKAREDLVSLHGLSSFEELMAEAFISSLQKRLRFSKLKRSKRKVLK